MKKIRTWKSIYDQTDRLYLDWDIHYQCNFDCTYCFQKFEGNLGTKIPEVNKNIKMMLTILEKHPLDFTLGLLGGEPTLNQKEYFLVLDSFKTMDKPLSEIYVSTNLSKPKSFYENHPVYHNVYQWVSIHPEYHLKDKDFFQKLELLLIASPDQLILSPMLWNITPEVLSFYEKVYAFYLEHKDKNIIYSPQIIFQEDFIKNNAELWDYSNPVFNSTVKEFSIDNTSISLNNFITNPISFKGSTCSYNYYCISPELDCIGDCVMESFNIKENPIKFLNLKPKEIVCKKKLCLDYPMLLSSKKLI